MIKKLIRWSNDTVSVFDERGNQLPDYQGVFGPQLRLVLKSISDEHTQFYLGVWKTGFERVDMETFFRDQIEFEHLKLGPEIYPS